MAEFQLTIDRRRAALIRASLAVSLDDARRGVRRFRPGSADWLEASRLARELTDLLAFFPKS
ncbi:MAG: hypothetical protein JSS43_17510 [Proteobacteria bacterium]|nr:hypothetical protein [Pseudomonadota bacterium]